MPGLFAVMSAEKHSGRPAGGVGGGVTSEQVGNRILHSFRIFTPTWIIRTPRGEGRRPYSYDRGGRPAVARVRRCSRHHPRGGRGSRHAPKAPKAHPPQTLAASKSARQASRLSTAPTTPPLLFVLWVNSPAFVVRFWAPYHRWRPVQLSISTQGYT